MSIEDYEILNILGNNINSKTYKVKHRKTNDILVWKTFNFDKSNNEKNVFFKLLSERMKNTHPNFIKLYDVIEDCKTGQTYLVTEYCESGSLRDTINSCIRTNTYLSEEFVYKIIYQVAFILKTCDNYKGKLKPEEIFFNADYNVKLYNFQEKKNLEKEPKMCHLGLTLFEATTLEKFDKNTFENDINERNPLISSGLISFIVNLIKDSHELKKNVNKVLCHETVLLKSNQWLKDRTFLELKDKKSLLEKGVKSNKDFNFIIEQLRDKETFLQDFEQRLKEKERILDLREQKIILFENSIQKFKKHEKKTGKINVKTEKKISYENLNSTYVSCGDSVLLPTSKRLNVNEIIKPASFTRTLSEKRIKVKGHSPLTDIDLGNKRNEIIKPAPFTRTFSEKRIKFKGHSPLKEVDLGNKRTRQLRKQRELKSKSVSEWLTCSESCLSGEVNISSKTFSKQLFMSNNVYENNFEINKVCQPVAWNRETKKLAFNLLKTIKTNEQPNSIKHTL